MALDDPADHGDEHLPCGADLADLWDTGIPATGHTDCPRCRDALTALASLQDTVRTAMEEDRATPAHPAFLDRVMTAVRTELRPGPLVPLGADEQDDDWITGTACAQVLRAAVDALAGVRAGSCRVFTLADQGAGGLPGLGVRRLPRGPLMAAVEVFTDLSRPLPETVDLVRAAVVEAAAVRVGVRITGVDVTVRDLLPERDGT